MSKSSVLRKSVLSILISSAISAAVFATDDVPTTSTNESAVASIFNFTSIKPFTQPIDVTENFTNRGVFNLDRGSLTFRFKNSGNGLTALLGASDPTSNTKYLLFYVLKTNQGDKFGIEIRNNTNLIPSPELVTDVIPAGNDPFKTVTYTFDKDNRKISIYVDGKEVKTYSGDTKFFNDIPGLTTAFVGKTKRAGWGEWNFAGDVYYAGADDKVLTAEEIQERHNKLLKLQELDIAKYHKELEAIARRHDDLGAFKSTKDTLFQPGQEGAQNYRIPALLTTQNGTVIAAIDKRHQHSADWGNIDTAIRRSLDGGKTWQNDQVVIDLVEQPYGTANSAFLIDPVMVQDKKTGRIFMAIDMFPETQGFFGIKNHAAEGSGYKNIQGKHYRLLRDANGNQYTVRENGVVYNEENQPTNYRVEVVGNAENHFKDIGNLYENDNLLGNVFLTNPNQVGSKAAPLTANITSYFWLTYSDDDGQTWASPVDLTPQIKADWMRFLGTGPGTGIQLADGSLVLPVYYTNSNNTQSAALIISKDGGKTWTRGESPNDRRYAHEGGSRLISGWQKEITESQLVQLNNGDLKLFSRNQNGHVLISTSKDGGYTWQNNFVSDEVLLDPYSQMSVIKYSKLIAGKEYIIFANPHSGSRSRVNGTVWLGEVKEDGNIEWQFNTNITTGGYAYNSLTELPDGKIGLLYEGEQGKIEYVRLNLQELFWQQNIIYRDVRDTEHKNVSLDVKKDGDPEVFFKIGDGEMIKVGSGINNAKLIIEEGIATLNQEADEQGYKQAYKEIEVRERGIVRLGDNEQIDYGNLHLNGGWVDINGNIIAIDNSEEKTGLRSTEINGNFVNLAEKTGTLIYKVNGNNTILGSIGTTDETGGINFTYEPGDNNSHLTLAQSSIVNIIDVKTGHITHAPNTYMQASEAKVRTGANLNLNATRAAIGTITLENDANMLVTNNSDLRANEATISTNAHLTIRNSDVAIGSLTVEENANLTVESTNEQWFGTKEIKGLGKLIKEGKGTLLLGGNVTIAHTEVKNGNVELVEVDENTPSSIAGNLTVHAGATLGGQGEVLASTIWKEGSIISPGFNRPTVEESDAQPEASPVLARSAFRSAEPASDSFKPMTSTFNDVTNEGAAISLRVNNNAENFKNWLHDKVIIKGNLIAENPTSVHLEMLGTAKANSDTNNNGKYDTNEGLSLIQVHGESDVGKFTIGNIKAAADSVYQLALVSFEKGVDELAYYDYQLHNKLITENGEEVSTIVRKPEPEPEVQPEPQPEAQPEPQPEVQPEPQPEVQPEPQPEVQPEPQPEVQPEPQPEPQPEVQPEVQPAPAQPTPPAARTALNEAIPSYLVANIALMNQGDSIRDAFTSTLWTQNRKGFYVIQKYADAGYTSNLSFANYGYNYDSKQHATLFGGYIPVSNNTELHAGVGFSTLKVTPKAADGHSSARYKTTSLLLAMHNNWDNNVVLNTHLGYHWHRGTISSATRDIRVTGSQLQVGTEIGYNVKLNQVTLTPVAGISYQYLDVDNNWKLNDGAYKAFTQHIGSYLTWNNERVSLRVGALYENNSQTNQHITIDNSQFATGKLGNSVLFKTNAEVSILPQLKLGVQLEHRQGISKAKLKQTSVQAQLNYQF